MSVLPRQFKDKNMSPASALKLDSLVKLKFQALHLSPSLCLCFLSLSLYISSLSLSLSLFISPISLSLSYQVSLSTKYIYGYFSIFLSLKVYSHWLQILLWAEAISAEIHWPVAFPWLFDNESHLIFSVICHPDKSCIWPSGKVLCF